METQAEQAALQRVLETLDEGQKRWVVAREAMRLGRGGVRRMCQASGLSKPTVVRGVKELRSQGGLRRLGRVRQSGGGRKRIEAKDPAIMRDLQAIMKENTAGDPMTPLKWTHKSTYQIKDQLRKLGHEVSKNTVGRLLGQMGYSLQASRKDKEGLSPPGRNRQFEYLKRLIGEHLERGEPVISVDAKKKEPVGCFKNAGRQWRRKGRPRAVNVYDFPSLSQGRATPYGAYDVGKNQGMVNVGMSRDTAEFAVESIRRWWRKMGARLYPKARRLLICADGGGSNGARKRAWKYHLQELSRELGMEITVCHYPPGTSKWNEIEHRMFSFISMNWRGEPLCSFETVVNWIKGTSTRTGLKVKAILDKTQYEAGEKISDRQMKELNLLPHQENPQWNYTLLPKAKPVKAV